MSAASQTRSVQAEACPTRLTGWGMTEATVAEVALPRSADEVAGLVKGVGASGVIARGLGRSYNNAAQNDGGLVVTTTGMCDVLSFDSGSGLVTCEAGVSLEQLITGFLPAGWFVPVSPGTRQVTVGGAIASDVHGKNHHAAGSFARHVTSFDLLMADGAVRTVTPESNPELFWATAGGMGLTGIILRATVRLKKVETSRLVVDTVRTADIDETMAYLSATDKDYDYTVAWTDCLASGGSLGRSVITSGDFATIGEVDEAVAAARQALVQTFGRLPAHSAATPGDASTLLVRAQPPAVGWAVAAWLVTHAAQYRLRDVSFAGFRWSASLGGSWTKDRAAPAGAVVAT